MPTSSLQISSRAPHLAAVFALVIGGAIVWFGQGSDRPVVEPAMVSSVPGPVSMPSVPVESAAAATAAASLAAGPVAAESPTVPAPQTATVPDFPAEPFDGVIVEPVDPAEALFGDRAQVAVSN